MYSSSESEGSCKSSPNIAQEIENQMKYRSQSEDNIPIYLKEDSVDQIKTRNRSDSFSHQEINNLLELEDKLGAMNNVLDHLLLKNNVSSNSESDKTIFEKPEENEADQ